MHARFRSPSSALLLALAVAAAPLPARAQLTGCARNIGALQVLLGRSALPLRWIETSMADGKPLVMAISERDGALHLAFHKTGEGAWFEAQASICVTERELEVRLVEATLVPGPAVPWLVPQSLALRPRLTLAPSAPPIQAQQSCRDAWRQARNAMSRMSLRRSSALAPCIGRLVSNSSRRRSECSVSVDRCARSEAGSSPSSRSG